MGKFSKFNKLLQQHIVLAELERETNRAVRKEFRKLMREGLTEQEKTAIEKALLA